MPIVGLADLDADNDEREQDKDEEEEEDDEDEDEGDEEDENVDNPLPPDSVADKSRTLLSLRAEPPLLRSSGFSYFEVAFDSNAPPLFVAKPDGLATRSGANGGGSFIFSTVVVDTVTDGDDDDAQTTAAVADDETRSSFVVFDMILLSVSRICFSASRLRTRFALHSRSCFSSFSRSKLSDLPMSLCDRRCFAILSP